jgi:hypothetical protein
VFWEVNSLVFPVYRLSYSNQRKSQGKGVQGRWMEVEQMEERYIGIG